MPSTERPIIFRGVTPLDFVDYTLYTAAPPEGEPFMTRQVYFLPRPKATERLESNATNDEEYEADELKIWSIIQQSSFYLFNQPILTREIPEADGHWVFKNMSISYDLSPDKLPVRLSTEFRSISFVRAELLFGPTDTIGLATLTYDLYGRLVTVLTQHDTDPDLNDGYHDYTREAGEQYAREHPEATEEEIDKVEDMALMRWKRLYEDIDTVVRLVFDPDGPYAEFYDNLDDYYTGVAPRQIEALTPQKAYTFFGDRFVFQHDEDKNLGELQVFRESGREVSMTFPMTIPAETRQEMVDKQSFAWAQWEWIKQLTATIKHPANQL